MAKKRMLSSSGRSKRSSPAKLGRALAAHQLPASLQASFAEVVELIQQARRHALQTVNTALIDLYWQIGEYISSKLDTAAWGEGVVEQLAEFIAARHPDIRGFTRASLFRMRQFYATYRHDERVAPLVRQLPWTHNLLIMSRC